MAQQSTNRPRESEKVIGSKTREQQKAVIAKRENTKGADVSVNQKSLAEVAKEEKPRTGEFDLSTVERSIKHVATQGTKHHKSATG